MVGRRTVLAMALPVVAARPAASMPPKGTRGLYVWATVPILTDDAEFDAFVNEVRHSGATRVFLYVTPQFLTQFGRRIDVLIGALSLTGVETYGMNGWRGYFSDASGPKGLYACVQAMLDHNAHVGSSRRFVGFMADMEPQDGQGVGRPLFHNSLKESALNVSQRADRDRLMADWVRIHDTVARMLRPAGMRFASSLPSWTDDYYGEPVLATVDGVTQDVTRFLMAVTDDFCIMSYNTNPSRIISRIVSKLRYADTLRHPPRVFGTVETHRGPGAGISYGDTPSKRSRNAVVADLDTVCAALNRYKAFAGMNIHDYRGWAALPVAHAGAGARPGPEHVGHPSACGWRA